jgi:hypothetical protein
VGAFEIAGLQGGQRRVEGSGTGTGFGQGGLGEGPGVNPVAVPHLDRDALEARLRALPAPASDSARVDLLVQRLPGELRQTPASVRLDVEHGVVGDRWSLSRLPKRDAQVTLMRADVARLFCNGGDLAPLGDNLFASIDTSAANLRAGTRLRVGEAICEVTAKAHTGCGKFAARVGACALELTRDPVWKSLQLRGVHLRVIRSGTVALGDAVVVERRP